MISDMFVIVMAMSGGTCMMFIASISSYINPLGFSADQICVDMHVLHRVAS
jgi:hypothetical protein